MLSGQKWYTVSSPRRRNTDGSCLLGDMGVLRGTRYFLAARYRRCSIVNAILELRFARRSYLRSQECSDEFENAQNERGNGNMHKRGVINWNATARKLVTVPDVLSPSHQI